MATQSSWSKNIPRPSEVEVDVVGQVDQRRFVGARLVFEAQLVVIGQPVGYGRRQIARIALLTVTAKVGEPDPPSCATSGRERPPRRLGRNPSSSVNVIWRRVLAANLYSTPSSVNRASAIRLATRPITAAGAGKAFHVSVEGFGSEHDIGSAPVRSGTCISVMIAP